MTEPNRQGEVWVFAEQEDGALHDVSLELCGKARELADRLGVKTGAVLPGAGVGPLAKRLIAQGIDNVYLADHPRLAHYQTLPYAKVLTTLIEKHRPQIVHRRRHGHRPRPGPARGLDAALRPDGRLHRPGHRRRDRSEGQGRAQEPAVADSPGLRRQHHRHDRQLRPVAADGHGARGRDAVEAARRTTGTGRVVEEKVEIDDASMALKLIQRHIEPRKVNLKGARVIVAGGGGIGSKDNFKLIYDLAGAIGGAVGASRAAVDSGYIGKEHQVGQTGTTVRPALYIAVGISGAVQHRAGMEESAKIIAINTDRDAPIFGVAHYGIVGDYKQVIPMMIKAIKEKTR